MMPQPIFIESPLEANLLEKFIASTQYAFKWKDRMVTMPRAEKSLEAYYRKPIKTKIMTLYLAKKQAEENSKKTKGKIYINVDDEGNCSTSKTFAIESSVFCYQKGCQVALTNLKSDGLKNQNPIMETKTKNVAKAAKKIEGKKEVKKETKKEAKKEIKTGHKPVKSAKAEGTAKQLTSLEIIKLINSGHKVTTTGGKPHTVRFMKTVTDKEKKREVLVVKS